MLRMFKFIMEYLKCLIQRSNVAIQQRILCKLMTGPVGLCLLVVNKKMTDFQSMHILYDLYLFDYTIEGLHSPP